MIHVLATTCVFEREREREYDTLYMAFLTHRAAIYANRLYLSLIHERQPELLATNGGDSESPHIIGHVRIHPTANIDPTCTVSVLGGYCAIHISLVKIDVAKLEMRLSVNCLSSPFYSLVLMCTLVPMSTVAAGARVKEAIILDRAEIQVCHRYYIVLKAGLLGGFAFMMVPMYYYVTSSGVV